MIGSRSKIRSNSSFFVFATTLRTFHLNIPFDEWINKFDKDEAPAREVKNIKVLFRGISKDILNKAIVVVQAEEGVLEQHIQENFETFEKNGAEMSSAVPSLWT